MPFWLNDLGIVSALGVGQKHTMACISQAPTQTLTNVSSLVFEQRPTFVGLVDVLPLTESMRFYKLIDLALAELTDTLAKVTCSRDRIAVVMGTSTAAIQEGERARKVHAKEGKWPAQFNYYDQALIAPAAYIAKTLDATGPCYSISTACSSSAKAMISARALLSADLADVVICGGVDSLCQLTVNGFDSLSSISDEICKPFSKDRKGINIGEAAAVFVMSKEQLNDHAVAFLGGGESSDAHHISAPISDGSGAISAMQKALNDANLLATDIDYINAHGTATVQNDAMESLAISKVFGNNTPVSSSKHLTGHTLGAAGALEAGLCWLYLAYPEFTRLVFNNAEVDESLSDINLITQPRDASVSYCLSNSFAFGGNNVSVILGHLHE
ncbi:3-oxoacyl-[acyl-carrier-protein] synthase-1 [Pseudoalteromonas sp. MBR-15]|jgi:3-oxoacyl-[acyl-carrier-protein] synthase-1